MNLARPELLTAALDSIDEGFAIFDADDRLAAFNDRYARVRSAIGGDVELGVSWDSLARASIRFGAIPEAIGREESWMAERRRRRGACSILRAMPDGRCFQVNERRMALGGIVAVWTDVTSLIRTEVLPASPDAIREQAFGRVGCSYDPHDLMAEARRWRELADQAPPMRREIYLSRAAQCETMAVRSVGMPALAG